MRRRRENGDGGQEIAELAALADGSLAPERRASIEAQVAASAELADLLRDGQRVGPAKPEFSILDRGEEVAR